MLFLTSCSSVFYQVYEVKSTSKKTSKKHHLMYEDGNCQIIYNFWSDGGNAGFSFFNKTDSKIYLNLKESHFILNGVAYDYFKNRTFTISNGKSESYAASGILEKNKILVGRQTSIASNASISVEEDSVICIPAKASKQISEYSINQALFRHCDLLRHPYKKQAGIIKFNNYDSPIIFENRLTYVIEGISKEVKNEFYISEITNYPESKFFEYKYDVFCGRKASISTKYYKFNNSSRFYFRYNR